MMRLSCDDMPAGGTAAGAVFENLMLRSVNSPELFLSSGAHGHRLLTGVLGRPPCEPLVRGVG